MPKENNILFFIDKNSDSYATRKMVFETYFKDFDGFNCCISSDKSDPSKLINDKNIDFIVIDADFDMSKEGMNGKSLYDKIKSNDKTTLPYFFTLTTEEITAQWSTVPALLGAYSDFVINVVDFNPQLAHAQIKSVNRRKDSENSALITINNKKFLFNGEELKNAFKKKDLTDPVGIQPDRSNQHSKLLKQYIEQEGIPVKSKTENKITNHLQYGIAHTINKNDGTEIDFEACLTISKKILKSMGEGQYMYDSELGEAWLVAEIKEEKSKSNNQIRDSAREASNAKKSSSSPEKVKPKPTTNNPVS